MALTSGARLGPYEILSAIGAGGMGEVYKARDTRLDRTVAIKILPPALAADPQFLDRFDREARAVSHLNHPNVCTLFDVGQQDDHHFIVMEFLDGESLADRLAREKDHGLPLPEALRIAVEIGSALDAAHRAGIVHRDLKPGNIVLTKGGGLRQGSGQAKLLDFGLAKTGVAAMSASGGTMMPTTPANITAQGTILGTFQYMAPEQLEGVEADARTDIFAFGAVLYEMITGRKAFHGQTQVSLIGSILKDEPSPISTITPLSPPALDWVVRKCLAKAPEKRWQSASDLVSQLEWLVQSSGLATAILPAAHAPSSVRRVWMLAAVAGLAVAAFLGGMVLRRPAARAQNTVRLSLLPPAGVSMGEFAISLDGGRLAFEGNADSGASQIWWRSFDTIDAQPLKGTENAVHPFWSPDGRSLAFYAQGKLKRIDVPGGSPQTICDSAGGGGSGAWSSEGVIVFGTSFGEPLHRVSAAGGVPSAATTMGAKEAAHLYPAFLPDGKHFLYFVRSAQRDVHGIYLASLDAPAGTRIASGDTAAEYAPPGYLLFARDGALVAQAFETSTLKPAGDVTTLAERVDVIEDVNKARFAVSRDGRLIYRVASSVRSQLVWLDTHGQAAVAGQADGSSNIALSPDERRVVFDRPDRQTSAIDLWMFDLGRGIASRATSAPSNDYSPVWSPDGSRVVFSSDRGPAGYYDLFEKPAAGGEERELLKSDADKQATDWSRDGRFIVFNEFSKSTRGDIWVLPIAGDRKPAPFLRTSAQELGGRFSPDGRWIAYETLESGDLEVIVQPFPATGAKFQASVGGGSSPRWGRDGQTLFYLTRERKLMAVAIRYQPGFEAAAPSAVFTIPKGTDYAVARDGRVLVNQITGDPGAVPLTVVFDWSAGLKR